VEEALAHRWTDEERAAEARDIDQSADITGGPETVRARLEEVVEATGADEVIVLGTTYDPAERRAALARLAEVMGVTGAPIRMGA
jgi:alkanesulfonate monooxygenase SsuD/methylene tetrahydromethanopterin reductase-like flavin-dependent oxidoreductase (luciferase family)